MASVWRYQDFPDSRPSGFHIPKGRTAMAPTSTPPKPQGPDERTLQRVLEVIKDLRYGSVEVVVHDGKVVQIERREKVRFETPAQR